MKLIKKNTNRYIVFGITFVLLIMVIIFGVRFLDGKYSINGLSGLLDRVEKLDELDSNTNSRIVGLEFTPDESKLIAIHEDGSLVTWELLNEKSVGSSVTIPEFNMLEFDNEASMILGYSDTITFQDYGENKDFLSSISIWDVSTGGHKICLSEDCDQPSLYYQEYRGATISPGGKYAILYSKYGWEIIDLSRPRSERNYTVSQNIVETINKITFTNKDSHYIIGYREGVIEIFSVKHWFPIWIRKYIQATENDSYWNIIDQQMSPNGDFVAVVSKDQIFIWDLSKKQDESFWILVEGAKLIEFDATSRYLVIGTTNDELIVWDINEDSESMRFPVPGLSAFAVSDQGNFLAWGDSKGVIHICKIIYLE